MKRECVMQANAPSGVTLINYIESNGDPTKSNIGQIINTNIDSYKLETTLKFAENTTGSRTNNIQLCCGLWNANNNRYYVVQHANISYSNRIGLWTSDKSNNAYRYTTTSSLYTEHTIIYNDDNNRVYFDGASLFTVSDITTQNLQNKISMFGVNDGSNIIRCSPWRIFYAKFRRKDTNTVLGEFFPALDASNIPCLWDSVTEQCFYNQGTGQFIYA